MNPEPKKDKLPVVGIVMGSRSDWQTMKACADVLDEFDVDYEKRIISAHRTPELLREYGMKAVARGLRVIIAGAGGAAHLPGMMASYTSLPVLGVPVESKVLRGMDSLLSIVQMPFGIPVGCLAIGESGAKNAALLAVAILAIGDKELAKKLETFRIAQTQKVLNETL